MATEAAAPRHMQLQGVMHNEDVMCLVFRKLPTVDLLRCTMVCRGYCELIDKHVDSSFQRHLFWNGYFFERWAPLSHTSHVVFDIQKCAFLGSVLIDKPEMQHVWRFNVVPVVSKYLSVRLRISLPLNRLRLSGDQKLVDHFLELQEVSVDIKRWQIMELKIPRDREGRGLGQMLLKGVLDKNNPSLVVETDYDIIINVKNVPVVPIPRINYRVLCVMRGVLFCMNCFQREPKWQSLDVEDARHRVVCGLCFDILFVLESALKGKWMIRDNISRLNVHRSHFVLHQNQARTTLSANARMPCMLKQGLSEALGHKNWNAFICDNHMRSRATGKHLKRFSFVR